MKRKLRLLLLAVALAIAVTAFAACNEPDPPRLSFDPNGGTACSALTLDGSAQTLPTPTRDNYEFNGWYFDNGTFINVVTATMLSDGTITADTTVYAKWELITYTLTFDANGGTDCDALTLNWTEKTLPTPTRAKYEFAGWFFDDETFTDAVTDAMLSDGTITADTTVYAKWELITYTLTFDANGGTDCEALTLDWTEKTLPTSTRDKYEFAGWFFDDETFTDAVTDAMLSDGTITEDTTVYAKWELITYTLTFDANGGTDCEALTLDWTEKTLPTSTRDKYEFAGWFFDDETFTDAVTDAMLSDGTITEDTTVYAKWELITYTLTFDANGGTDCDALTLDWTEKTLPTPTRDKYEFAGWFFDDETFTDAVTNAMLSDGTITADTTVYAKWERNVFSVTVYADGAQIDSFEIEKGKKIVEPEYPTRDGYAFDGWYTDAATTQTFDFGASIGGDVALYGTFLPETSGELLKFTLAEQYFGFECCGITGVVDGAVLPEDLVIPAVYEGYPVVCIFWDAFKDQSGIRSVYIPDSVTTICSNAFNGCTALTKVRMTRAVAEVGNGAFYNTALYNDAADGYFYVGSVLAEYKGAVPANFEVQIKEGTRVIADRVFWLSPNVVKVELPSTLVYVGFNAFLRAPVREYSVPAANAAYAVVDGVLFSKDLTQLVYYPVGSDRESYVVPDTVTAIGDEAFMHVYHLKRVVIADSVQTLGDGVFDESETLEEVVFGAGIKSVGDGVLHEQDALLRIIVKSPVPFSFGVYFLDGSGTPKYDIYVADEYLATYKAESHWQKAAARMHALSELSA